MEGTYVPSEAENKTLQHVMERYQDMVDQRGKDYHFFGQSKKLLNFVDDCEKRFNGYIPPRADLQMDWQSRVFINFTRDVVISYLAKTAMNRPSPNISVTTKTGFVDVQRARILSKCYDYSQNREQGDWKFFNAGLEVVVKGTVIAYEGYRRTTRKIREISSYDPASGLVQSKPKIISDYDDCWRQTIPIEDFFVGNIYEPSMEGQDDVIWRSLMTHDRAEAEFAKYKNFSKVTPGNYSGAILQLPFYKELMISNLKDKQVEVIRYYNRKEDQMVYLLNGVVVYDGPIPFHHKKLPFAKAIYEPFGQFFYGNSLPNKVASQQDIWNTLWSMGLDQTYLSIFKPIFTDDDDELETTPLIPGAVVKVGDITKYKVMNEMTGPDSSYFNMLSLVEKYAKENSGPSLGGGSAATAHGGAVTARQALMQEEQSRAILGLNSWLFEQFERDCAELRVKNILQFYPLPKASVVSGEETGVFSRIVKVDDTELSDGSFGISIVKFANNDEGLPDSQELEIEEEAAKLQGENLEISIITPSYIRQLDIDITIQKNSTFKTAQALQQALDAEFYTTMLANPLVDQEVNTREFIVSRDKDPEKWIKKQAPMMPGMPGMEGIPGMEAQGQPGPTPELASQMLGRGEGQSPETSLGKLL